MCFVYSILAVLNPSSSHKKHDPVLYKNQMHQLDLQHVEFPMPIASIPKFEADNNLVINFFDLDKNELSPLFLSKKLEERINLLILIDGVLFHYCLITNFNAFMSRQFDNKTQ